MDRKKQSSSVGAWTIMCFAYTAIHAIKEKYEVYGLIDAAGDSTVDTHNYGVERMLQVRMAPLTLEALVPEWIHDWNNLKAGELVAEVYSKNGAMIGLR